MSRREHLPQDITPRRHWKRGLSLGLAMLTCPCHVPVLLGLLTGTVLGAWLQHYVFVVALTMSGIFALTLYYGVQRH